MRFSNHYFATSYKAMRFAVRFDAVAVNELPEAFRSQSSQDWPATAPANGHSAPNRSPPVCYCPEASEQTATYYLAMTSATPNILLILTDEERYQPDYERDQLADFRSARLPARSSLEQSGIQLGRHYTAATACAPSRTTLFTGQYPSLHGVRNTDGIGKSPHGPGIKWFESDDLPTMGHWFRAAGYRTFYRGKCKNELFDLAKDPGAMTNLWDSPDHLAVKVSMLELLAEHEINAIDRVPFPTAEA